MTKDFCVGRQGFRFGDVTGDAMAIAEAEQEVICLRVGKLQGDLPHWEPSVYTGKILKMGLSTIQNGCASAGGNAADGHTCCKGELHCGKHVANQVDRLIACIALADHVHCCCCGMPGEMQSALYIPSAPANRACCCACQ